MRTHLPSTRQRARKQRRQMSPAEIRLWQVLKTSPGGRKYRRLHPLGRFVADFYCDAAKIIIEVDGQSHDFGDQPDFDEKRDAWFEGQGIRVIRIAARDVFSNLDGVVQHILLAADAAGPPPPRYARSPSPDGGGLGHDL